MSLAPFLNSDDTGTCDAGSIQATSCTVAGDKEAQTNCETVGRYEFLDEHDNGAATGDPLNSFNRTNADANFATLMENASNPTSLVTDGNHSLVSSQSGENTQAGENNQAADNSKAVRSASTMAINLLFTAILGFVVQILAQNHLGKHQVGLLGGGESLAIIVLGLLSFGVDTYALKEVAIDPGHAKSFVSGIVIWRGALSVAFIAGTCAILSVSGRSSEAIILFSLFGVARVLLQSNELLGSCLKAINIVRPLSPINAISKVVWAIVVLGGVLSGRGPICVPIGWILGEGLKFVLTAKLCRKHLGLRFTLRNQAVISVFKASLPYCAGVLVAGWSGYFDITFMSFRLAEGEVGLYRFAQQFSSIAFLLGTVLPWVILPLASRAFARSREEYLSVCRGSIQFVVTLAVPISVGLALNADTILGLVDKKWLPAVPALRLLSLSLVSTYLVLTAILFLQIEGRSWLSVKRSAVTLLSGMVTNVLFLHNGPKWFGVGGGGTFAALVVLLVELATAVSLFRLLDPQMWTGRTKSVIWSAIFASASVAVWDRVLKMTSPDLVRLFVDAILFVIFFYIWGVVTSREIKSVVASHRAG